MWYDVIWFLEAFLENHPPAKNGRWTIHKTAIFAKTFGQGNSKQVKPSIPTPKADISWGFYACWESGFIIHVTFLHPRWESFRSWEQRLLKIHNVWGEFPQDFDDVRLTNFMDYSGDDFFPPDHRCGNVRQSSCGEWRSTTSSFGLLGHPMITREVAGKQTQQTAIVLDAWTLSGPR